MTLDIKSLRRGYAAKAGGPPGLGEMKEQTSRTLRLAGGVATTAAITLRQKGQPLKTSDLFAGSREVMIEHNGELYQLRETSKGRLILTK